MDTKTNTKTKNSKTGGSTDLISQIKSYDPKLAKKTEEIIRNASDVHFENHPFNLLESLETIKSTLSSFQDLDDDGKKNAVEDLLTKRTEIEEKFNEIMARSFDAAIGIAAKGYPHINPPLDQWMRGYTDFANNNTIPYSVDAFRSVIFQYPLDTLVDVLPFYFDPVNYPDTEVNREAHASAFLDYMTNELLKVKEDGENVLAAYDRWIPAFDRLLDLHDEHGIKTHAEIPARIFNKYDLAELFYPYVFEKWGKFDKWEKFSSEQLAFLEETMSGHFNFELNQNRTVNAEKDINILMNLPWPEWKKKYGEPAEQISLAIKNVLVNLPEDKMSPNMSAMIQKMLLTQVVVNNNYDTEKQKKDASTTAL